MIRWVYGKEKCGKYKRKLKTNLQYEVFRIMDHNCVPNLDAMEVKTKH